MPGSEFDLERTILHSSGTDLLSGGGPDLLRDFADPAVARLFSTFLRIPQMPGIG